MTADGKSRQHGGGKRRGRRVATVAAVVVAAWLAGRGLMLVGREPAPGGGFGTVREDATPEPMAVVAPHPTPADGVAATGATPAALPAAPPAPPTRTPPVEVEADRFAALRSAVEAHRERGELVAAVRAVAHLRGLSLTPEQRAAVDADDAALRTATERRVAAVAEAVATGRARVAAAGFAPIAALAGESVAWLPELLGAAGFTAWRQGELAADSALPAPRPLARGRAVTAQGMDGSLRGVVVAADSGECTLRVEQPSGVAFPSVPLVDCEPDEPSVEEAVELALAAARAGDALLARAWAHVAARRGGADLPRLRRVVAALP